MEQYIKKSDLVTEIEKRIKEIDEIGTYLSPKGVLTNLLCHLDTLETKEVDLVKEYDKNFSNDPVYSKLVNRNAGIGIGKHFFNLGLKLQKGE